MAMYHYLYVITLEILILAFFPSPPAPALRGSTSHMMLWHGYVTIN